MRPATPIPVSAWLVPESPVAAPDGFAVADLTLSGPLPLRIALFGDVVATVVMPTGLGRQWKERLPSDVVSSGAAERATVDSTSTSLPETVSRAPARILLERAGVTTAVVPLTVDLRASLPAGDGARVEVSVLSWELRAGTVRDGGDVGSRVTLAWRDSSIAPAQFLPEAIHPRVAARRALSTRRHAPAVAPLGAAG